MTNGTRPEDKPALTDDRRIRFVGIALVVIVFAGFGSWSLMAPLSSAAVAPGVIVVEGYSKTVQHLEGGIVKSISVRDGQSVEKNQTLLTLDDTQASAQLEVLRGQQLVAAAREARLIAERDGLVQVQYPSSWSEYQGEARAREALQVQNQIFRARKAAHDNEMSLYTEQLGQLAAKAGGMRAQIASREQFVTSFAAELKDFQILLDRGYTEKQKVRELERSVAQSEGQLGELKSGLAATDLQISETRLKIVQLQKERQREVVKDMAEVQAQLFELSEKIRSLRDTLRRTHVQAPQSGIVLDLKVNSLGAVLRPGEKLMDIVPRGDKLIVEAKVSLTDIDKVRVGQIAEVRFSAFKTRDTPYVEGKIVTLSADRLIDAGDSTRTPYYLARIEIATRGLEDLVRQKLQLTAGMPTEVLIKTGERTLFDYLIDPIKNTMARSFKED